MGQRLKITIYCDNRKTLSYPAVRTFIRQQFVQAIDLEFGRPDIVAGVATGGIAHGALVAHDPGLPFVYVRSSAKNSMKNQVEGDLTTGRSVVVVEDFVSTGKSSLAAVHALRDEGCEVKGMVSIFAYGFDEAVRSFEQEKVETEVADELQRAAGPGDARQLHHREGHAEPQRMAERPRQLGKASEQAHQRITPARRLRQRIR